jgi:hypothetical protein
MIDGKRMKLAILITCLMWFSVFIYLTQRKHVKTLEIKPYEISKDYERLEKLVEL